MARALAYDLVRRTYKFDRPAAAGGPSPNDAAGDGAGSGRAGAPAVPAGAAA
jgi:hypothetical protein